MSTAVIIIAIGVVVVLGAMAFFTLARRSDVRGAGALSARPCSATSAAEARRTPSPTPTTAAEVEAAGSRSRRDGRRLASPRPGSSPWTPPDPEAIGVTRRQFFNRATISLMAAGLGAFAAASFVAFLWPTRTGGFGGRSPSASSTTSRTASSTGDGFFYAAEARSWITEYPAEALPLAEDRVPRLRAVTGSSRASSSSVRSARTSAAACRSARRASGSNVSATARSTTASVRRRAARHRAAWITSRRRSRGR